MIFSGMYAHIAYVSQIQFKPKIKGHLQDWSFFQSCCYLDNIINPESQRIDTCLSSNINIITAKKGIMIVDDELDIANLYKLSLERDGFSWRYLVILYWRYLVVKRSIRPVAT